MGQKASEGTFGHLGFTGTGVWIDPIRKKGVVVLSNVTRGGWFNKKSFNKFRKEVVDLIWESKWNLEYRIKKEDISKKRHS